MEEYLYTDELKETVSDNFYFYTNKQVLEIFIITLSDFFAIIPYCIRKKRLRKNNDNKEEGKNIDNEENENEKKIELIYNESNQSATKLKQKEIIFYLILIAALDFLKEFIFFLYYLICPSEDFDIFPFNYISIFDIILQFIFSYLILKIHFYKLQHFSLYLNVIIFIFILSFDLLDILKYKISDGYIYIFYPFYIICYCLIHVFGKKVILYGYISIFILIIMKGVIKLIINIVFSVILLIVNKILLQQLYIILG